MNALKAAFTSYLSHLSGYIISGATIVSTLAPGTFPPKYAFITAVATFVATAFSHGQAVQANAGSIVASVAEAATNAVNAAAKVAPVLLAILVLPLLMTLHGCATVSAWFSSPAAQPVIIAAVDVAVATAEQKGVTAVQINDVAKQALVANASTSATLATVSAVVNQQIAKLNLPAGDLAAVQILEIALAAEIQSRIGTNADLAAAHTAVADVLNAVIEATGG
jgi:hypothetical protein